MFLGTQDLKFYNSVDIFYKAIFRHIHIENYHTIISTLCFHVTILNRLNFRNFKTVKLNFINHTNLFNHLILDLSSLGKTECLIDFIYFWHTEIYGFITTSKKNATPL